MIIGDLNVESVAVTPYEADPVLVVDPNAMLPFSVTFESFQAIAGKNRRVRKGVSSVDLDEPSLDDLCNSIEALRISTMKNQLRIFGSKRPNHQLSV